MNRFRHLFARVAYGYIAQILCPKSVAQKCGHFFFVTRRFMRALFPVCIFAAGQTQHEAEYASLPALRVPPVVFRQAAKLQSQTRPGEATASNNVPHNVMSTPLQYHFAEMSSAQADAIVTPTISTRPIIRTISSIACCRLWLPGCGCKTTMFRMNARAQSAVQYNKVNNWKTRFVKNVFSFAAVFVEHQVGQKM